ncbi:MAG TPA: hypothetical protein DCL61_04685, partial [Cyanobacteria bacterium UBA12227]|nr:hypothetical protein [Cyanobacteria bacterium UBA12227]
ESLFSRKSPEAEAIKEFSQDSAPDVLLGRMQGGIIDMVSDRLLEELEKDFKSINDPDALNHRIFAICIASAESQKTDFAYTFLPYYGEGFSHPHHSFC